MFYWNWLTSRLVRQATELKQQARKILNHQRDLLSPEAIEAVASHVEAIKKETHASRIDKEALRKKMDSLESVAGKWLKPYKHAGIRENIEVFLVAGAVALAVRTFFFQPMAIPTGSAQPTFWGIEHEDYRDQPEVEFPTGFKKWYLSWIKGEKYYHVVAKESGEIRVVDIEPKRVFLFLKKQTFYVGGEKYTIWFPPDQLFKNPVNRSGLSPHDYFEKGDDIIKLRVDSGDHLFVNRLVYNFRKPKRGETIVFMSAGIPDLIQNTHYIKRLVAMDGDRVRIGDDRHIVLNGRRLDASDPGFEMVYSFDPGEPPKQNEYSGHANGYVMSLYRPNLELATLFPDDGTEFKSYDLSLGIVGDVGGLPREGKGRVIVAKLQDDDILYFRIFNAVGEVIVDKPETGFSGKSTEIERLKEILASLWGRASLTSNQQTSVKRAIAAITGPIEYIVRPDHYLTFGDNTMNSKDSRDWGDFPREKTIGRASFVFWPITERFGWHRK